MKNGNFDIHIWNEIRLKLLNEVSDVKESLQFYEMLLYIMETISGMFGIVAMRYNKK
jgi:hypothetical protein